MKTESITAQITCNYESPKVEIFECEVEKGFATSTSFGGTGDDVIIQGKNGGYY